MDFKGTKGKWKTKDGSNVIVDGELIATSYGFLNKGRYSYTDETKANALLISKAPEMLEMLEKCYEYFLLKTDELSDRRADAIGQLIKEATEI